jgi:hypothetical protein
MKARVSWPAMPSGESEVSWQHHLVAGGHAADHFDQTRMSPVLLCAENDRALDHISVVAFDRHEIDPWRLTTASSGASSAVRVPIGTSTRTRALTKAVSSFSTSTSAITRPLSICG